MYFLAATLLLSLAIGRAPIPEVRILDLNAEMKEFLAEKVDRRSPELERLNRLVSVIFQDKTLGFTYKAGRNQTAIETFTSKQGNCLSYTTMFLAMARHLDIDVRFNEARIVPTWTKRGNLVVFSRHVNVIAYIGIGVYEVDLFPRVNEIKLGGHVVSDERGTAHYFSNIGAHHLSEGRPLLARDHFLKAIEVDDTAAFAWGNLGVVQSSLGNLQEAENSYRRAIRLDRDNLTVVQNLAKLYRRMGKDKKADEAYRKVERFRRKNPFYHYRLGEEAFHNGDYRLSVKHYKAAIKRRSGDHTFYFALARAYLLLGESDKVEKSLLKARRFAPDENGQRRYSQKLEILASRH